MVEIHVAEENTVKICRAQAQFRQVVIHALAALDDGRADPIQQAKESVGSVRHIFAVPARIDENISRRVLYQIAGYW